MKRRLTGLVLLLTLGCLLTACGVKNLPEYKPETQKQTSSKSAS